MVLLLLVFWYMRHRVEQTSQATEAQRQEVQVGPDSEPALAHDDFISLQTQVAQAPSTRTSLFGWRTSSVTDAWTLSRVAPICINLYHSPTLLRMVQLASGFEEQLKVLPISMPLSCSLLRYDEAGDHISWHYERNYFRGRTVTVLLTVFNRNATGQCCSGNQSCRLMDGKEECRDTRENSLTVLDGSRILHSTRKLSPGEQRVVLSMVFCTDSHQTPWQKVCTSVKEWSFFR